MGVFFGLGALGMPLVLGMLSEALPSLLVVAAVGWLTLVVGLYYVFIQFPPAKQVTHSLQTQRRTLFKPLLFLIAFFLFFLRSLEAIINNWTTTYLVSRGIMPESEALYALSLHIAGMVVMRLLTGTVFRSVSPVKILWVSLGLLAVGIALMQVPEMCSVVMAGLFLSGAGLAGGFPIMLGFVGESFARPSATAFSIAFTVALIGNMLINYAAGIIVDRYGVHHFATISYVQIVIMALLFLMITRKLKINQNTTSYVSNTVAY